MLTSLEAHRAPGSIARAALLLLLSPLLAGCVGTGRAYDRIYSIFSAEMPPEVPLPAPESMDEACGPGTKRYTYDFDDHGVRSFEWFCAGPDGETEGPFMIGHEVSGNGRVAAGRMSHGVGDGLFFGMEMDQRSVRWYEARLIRGRIVGHLRGAVGDKRTEGDYDTDHKMDGDWVIDGKRLRFDHGSGLVDWRSDIYDYKGMCKDGLREGSWSMKAGDLVMELTYARGTPTGAARVLRQGKLTGEGEIREGVVVRWRKRLMGDCLRSTFTYDEESGHRQELCAERALPSFWSCVYEGGSCRDPQPEVHDDPGPEGAPPPLSSTPPPSRIDRRPAFGTIEISLQRDQHCPSPQVLEAARALGIPNFSWWEHRAKADSASRAQ